MLDGALGTELIRGGMKPGSSTIAQNRDLPELVLTAHRSYVEAGADAVTSNTFAGNIVAMEKAGLKDVEKACNHRGMELVNFASMGKAKAAAGMGPTGEFYREFDAPALEEVFTRQAELLKRAAPDFFLIETMFDLREALAALKGTKLAAGDTPVALTMTFNRTPRGFFSMMGDRAVQALASLQEAGADAVGANCSLAPEEMLRLTEEVRGAVEGPLIMQPNAGQPVISGSEIVYDMSARDFAKGLLKLTEAGADIVGGCCGSTPEMMKLAAEMVKR